MNAAPMTTSNAPRALFLATLLTGSFLLFLTALATLPRPGSSRRSRVDDQDLLEG